MDRRSRIWLLKIIVKICLGIGVKLIESLEGKSNNKGNRSRICCWTIWKPFTWSWNSSFWAISVDRTSLEIFVNIIIDIEITKTLTVTWLSFFICFIFVSYSCLFAISITIWPVTPCSTVTRLVAVARAILNCTSDCLLSCECKFTMNLMPLINRFDILESKCSVSKVHFLWHFQNFDF